MEDKTQEFQLSAMLCLLTVGQARQAVETAPPWAGGALGDTVSPMWSVITGPLIPVQKGLNPSQIAG